MPQLGPESFFYGLPKATLETHGPPPNPSRQLAGLPPFLQAAAWPRKLFLWASEGNVRDPRARPQTPLGSWQACLRSCRPQLGPASFFYGLPKATLETHGPRPKPLSAAGRRASSLGLSQATKAPACHVKQPPPPSAAWPRKLFLWASEGNVRDPRAPPPNPSRQLAGLPPFLQAAAWPRKLFLWASEGNVRDPRAPPPSPSRQLAGLPPFLQAAAWPSQLFLWASEGNVRDPRALLRRHHSCTGQTKAAAWLRKLFLCRSLAQKAFSMGFRRQR